MSSCPQDSARPTMSPSSALVCKMVGVTRRRMASGSDPSRCGAESFLILGPRVYVPQVAKWNQLAFDMAIVGGLGLGLSAALGGVSAVSGAEAAPTVVAAAAVSAGPPVPGSEGVAAPSLPAEDLGMALAKIR